jgi:hypothetical protein
MYLAMSASVVFATLTVPEITTRTRRLLGACLALIVAGMVTALTLTPVLLLATTVILFGLRSVRARAWAFLTGAIALFLLAFTEVGRTALERLEAQERSGTTEYSGLPQTIGYRLAIWERDYFPLIGGNELNGYGPLGPADQSVFPYTESMYIEVLMRGGMLLLVALVAMMFAALISMRRVAQQAKLRALPIDAAVASAIAVITLFLIFAQAIHPYLVDAGSSAFMFCAWGICSARLLAMRNAPPVPTIEPK